MWTQKNKTQSKNIHIIIFILTLLIFSPSIRAEIEPRTTRVVISGEESLATLLEYEKANNLGEPILVKKDNVCYLHQPIYIAADSIFRFEGKDCPELRMYAGTYIRIAGTAYFLDIKVTSADKISNTPIKISRAIYDKERPYIYTDVGAKYVHIENSEFSYLGYYDEKKTSWGVSFWHLKAGYVNNSSFHHNYFGIYTWDSKDVVIENSAFYENLEYGMDFHDYSDNFIVRNNKVFSNGNHGIIFSKFCDNNKIIDNVIYDHTLPAFVKGETRDYGIHGIMLHEASNNNLISGNILKNNDRSIFIYRSDDNIIEKNTIVHDRSDGIYLDNSYHNIIKENTAFDTGSYGLYSYYSANNSFAGNYFEKGTYFKDLINGQAITFASTKTYVPPNLTLLREIKIEEGEEEPAVDSPLSQYIDNKKKIFLDKFEKLGNFFEERYFEKVPGNTIPTNTISTYSASDNKVPTDSVQWSDYFDLTFINTSIVNMEGSQTIPHETEITKAADEADDLVEKEGWRVLPEVAANFFRKMGISLQHYLGERVYYISTIAILAAIIFGTDIIYKKFRTRGN